RNSQEKNSPVGPLDLAPQRCLVLFGCQQQPRVLQPPVQLLLGAREVIALFRREVLGRREGCFGLKKNFVAGYPAQEVASWLPAWSVVLQGDRLPAPSLRGLWLSPGFGADKVAAPGGDRGGDQGEKSPGRVLVGNLALLVLSRFQEGQPASLGQLLAFFWREA